MECGVNFFERTACGGISYVTGQPALAKVIERFTPTIPAGSVARGQRRSFVEKEQLGVVPRLHDSAFDALKLDLARNPALPPVIAVNRTIRIVKAASITHEQP